MSTKITKKLLWLVFLAEICLIFSYNRKGVCCGK